jgi:hypothetical protein
MIYSSPLKIADLLINKPQNIPQELLGLFLTCNNYAISTLCTFLLSIQTKLNPQNLGSE